jgi:large subunit ribosomal protein L24
MNRIRKGDQIVVTSGKDKGRQGTVLNVADDRVLVEAVNMVKKHAKANPMQGVEGGIVEKEMPLHISNVMLFNPITKKGDRVGFKVLEDGRKVRYFKSNGEVVDV